MKYVGDDCDQYWPIEEEFLTFDNIRINRVEATVQVPLDKNERLKHLMKAEVRVELYDTHDDALEGKNPLESQDVTHYRFNGWPEFGLPVDHSLKSFMKLVEIVSDLICDDDVEWKPMIHCRAGQGRSGTLLALVVQFYMLRKFPKDALSVKESLGLLRGYRRGLVEVQD